MKKIRYKGFVKTIDLVHAALKEEEDKEKVKVVITTDEAEQLLEGVKDKLGIKINNQKFCGVELQVIDVLEASNLVYPQ